MGKSQSRLGYKSRFEHFWGFLRDLRHGVWYLRIKDLRFFYVRLGFEICPSLFVVIRFKHFILHVRSVGIHDCNPHRAAAVDLAPRRSASADRRLQVHCTVAAGRFMWLISRRGIVLIWSPSQ